MAHFIKLNVLNHGHEEGKERNYISTLINLDMVVSIEPSKIHSLIFTKNNSTQPIRVRESLDEILKLSKCCK